MRTRRAYASKTVQSDSVGADMTVCEKRQICSSTRGGSSRTSLPFLCPMLSFGNKRRKAVRAVSCLDSSSNAGSRNVRHVSAMLKRHMGRGRPKSGSNPRYRVMRWRTSLSSSHRCMLCVCQSQMSKQRSFEHEPVFKLFSNEVSAEDEMDVHAGSPDKSVLSRAGEWGWKSMEKWEG